MNKKWVVEGIIGSGKSTVTKAIAEHFGFTGFYELPDNPTLPLYYSDMRKYGFALQCKLLGLRYKTEKLADKLLKNPDCKGVVLDRSILFDKAFATLIYDEDHMTGDELITYRIMNDVDMRTLRAYDLIIFLDVKPGIANARVEDRDRPMEVTASEEFSSDTGTLLPYLIKLDQQYRDLLDEIEIPVLKFDLNTENRINTLLEELEDY